MAWWGLAFASLPVAIWWLVGLSPQASPIAYGVAAIPALLGLRAVLDGRGVLSSLLSGAIGVVSLLGATGHGLVFVPFGLLAVALEVSRLRGSTPLATRTRTFGFALGVILAFAWAFASVGWFATQ